MRPTRKSYRRRLPRAERRQSILDFAIDYFAEHGFAADTRGLAKGIGVTQAILYRHFPNKDALIAAVFQQLAEQQQSRHWEDIIRDGKKPLLERLTFFFTDYAARTYTYQWSRIHMHASLRGGSFNKAYIKRVTEPLLILVAREIRRELGFSPRLVTEVTRMEIELLWILHYGLYYHPFRRFVYGMSIETAHEDIIRQSVVGVVYAVERYLREKYGDKVTNKRALTRRARADGAKRLPSGLLVSPTRVASHQAS